MDSTARSEETIFLEAIERTGAERETYLAQACGADETMLQRVRNLIASHEESPTYEGIGGLGGLGGLGAAAPGEQPSDRIGRYKLLQEIGSGGFGTVWMAEQQEPVRRRVALKIIKLGMDTREVVARFEAERQALAMMNHPSIAQVFDAGSTDSGRPYFVMELVRGAAITKYCDEQKLAMRERLGLFVQVCHAIQHAHQKGIIHRDIKPSNILISAGDDGRPLPKVIDFGIAKAMDCALTERTLFTQFEQMIGTPAYMSPEQAGAGPMDIDTRSDVYALGALLYEMLTGRPPFDGKSLVQAGFEGMRRVIREDEPPKPSTCLSSMQPAQLTTVAESRHTDAPKLVTSLKGDLDWIVMKALEKSRSRRYETAAAFASDVDRHLRDEVVTARPPSRAYLIGKTVRRHRFFFIACGAVLVALIIGIVASALQAVRARRAEADERSQRYIAEDAQRRAESTSYAMSLNLAQVAWESGDARLMHEALQATKDSANRGFEWFYWWRAGGLDRRTIFGSYDMADSIAVSRDGTRIVAGGSGNSATVWEAATGRKLLTLSAPDGEVSAVAISPDGTRIATCGFGEMARIWDGATGRELHQLRGLGVADNPPAAFSQDGQRLVTRGQGSTAIVWDVRTGQRVITLGVRPAAAETSQPPSFKDFLAGSAHQRAFANSGDREPTRVTAIAHPFESRIITGHANGTVTIWDSESGREIHTFRAHAQGVTSIAYSATNRMFATGSADRMIMLWNVEDGSGVFSIRASDPVKSLGFSPNGNELIAGVAAVARVWEVNSGRELCVLKGHLGPVTSVAFASDGKTIVTGGGSTIKLWDADPARYREGVALQRTEKGTPVLVFAPEQESLLTALPSGRIRRWDLDTGQESVAPKQADLLPAATKAISADGKWVITLAGSTVDVLESQTGRSTRKIDLPFTPLVIAVSPDATRLVAASGGKAGLWSLADGRQISPVAVSVAAKSISFSPTGDCFVVTDFSRASVYDSKTGGAKGTVQVVSDLAAISPNGQRLLTEEAGGARVWDLATGRELCKLRGHNGEITSAAFSADGKRIVTGSKDGNARIWDAKTGWSLLTLRGHADGIATVLFSPDNRRVFTMGLDGTIKVWSASGEVARVSAGASSPQK